MSTTIENGPVVPHAQALADEANRIFGTIFKTYEGHDPDRTHALDCWDTLDDRRDLAQWAKDNYERFGVDYIIHEQHIWNPEISPAWRPMADRGSPTNNHYDHVHISFNETAPPYEAAKWKEDNMTPEQAAQLNEMFVQIMDPKFGVAKALDNLNREVIALREEIKALTPPK
jgi:hypothetical protein